MGEGATGGSGEPRGGVRAARRTERSGAKRQMSGGGGTGGYGGWAGGGGADGRRGRYEGDQGAGRAARPARGRKVGGRTQAAEAVARGDGGIGGIDEVAGAVYAGRRGMKRLSPSATDASKFGLGARGIAVS